MNTINKITVKSDILQGLKWGILENSLDKTSCRVYKTTSNEDLSNNFEHNRVFNSIDVIEEMLISKMENPSETYGVDITSNAFKPIKTYVNNLKVIELYDNEIKG